MRARILACLGHTARIIEETAIGKVIFGLSLALLTHSLGYADLSPAHLHALLSEIFHVKNYIPLVLPLEPEICHEVIQSADTKVAIKPLSDYIREDDNGIVYFKNWWDCRVKFFYIILLGECEVAYRTHYPLDRVQFPRRCQTINTY